MNLQVASIPSRVIAPAMERDEPHVGLRSDVGLRTHVELRNVSLVYGAGDEQTLAVDRVSFELAKGETLALVGESGSGKSVTALSIMKLLPYPSALHPSGEIRFNGRELIAMTEREMRRVRGDEITIVFQEPMTSLNPLHTIEKQIAESCCCTAGSPAPPRAPA